jgi:FKBP-type peptidyl-prolyl cis-trans isomerase
LLNFAEMIHFPVKIAVLLLIFCFSCGPGEKTDKNNHLQKKEYNRDTLRDQFIKANKQIIQKENDEMDYYAKSHQMPFVKTNSGIRYYVYKPSVKGDSIKSQMKKSIDYSNQANAAYLKKDYKEADRLTKLSVEQKQITIDYEVKLLDGTLCYSSKTEGKKTFVVEEGNIESGIHSAVLYLKQGDKALIMIPSHQAHGLLGDFKKIPPQMPIIYDIEIN